MPNDLVPAAAPGCSPPTRRVLLGHGLPAALALATMPVAAEPVVVAPTDPIFDVLAAHKAAWDRYGTASAMVDTVAARQEGRCITRADRRQFREANRIEIAALDSLVATVPTTAAGVIAAFAWLWHTGDLDRIDQFVTTLAACPLAGGANA